MQRTLTLERDMSVPHVPESFCLVCETVLDSSSSTNIFYSSLPRYGELLASFVLRVLRPVASDLRSSYICSRCHDLFQMLEQAQWTVSSVKSEILKVYHSRVTDGAPTERKSALPVSHILPDDDMFVDDRSVVGKNIVDDGSFVDIHGLRSLNVARNEFDSLSMVIDNLNEASCGVDGKREIEASMSLHGQHNGYKLADLKVEAHTEKPTETEEGGIIKNGGNDAPVLAVDVSSRPTKNSAPEEREDASDIISQISNELQTNSRHEQSGSDTIDDISSSIAQSLDAPNDERSLYTLQCGLCGRLFRSATELQSHSLRHGGSLPYKCRECDGRFADVSAATDHSSEAHGSVKNCVFVSSEPADNETVDFSKEDWIVPEDFGKNALEDSTGRADGDDAGSDQRAERASWKSGRISKYSQKPLKYPCSTCGKKWRTSAELKTHVKSHSNLRPYMCEKCGQAYKHKHALEIHVGMHNGVSPFQCSVCNKCFTQKGALMRHLPMHTGETPYQCELCGKRFVHHTSYNMHALSHTGKKSYQCHIFITSGSVCNSCPNFSNLGEMNTTRWSYLKVCDLSLLSTSHLKRHMRVHTGEKPYSCALCGKSFAERYNLFAHQKIHDPVEIMAKAAKKMTYKCELCDEFFDKKQKLEDHTKEHNNHNHNHCSSNNDPANGSKWIGHTVEVETPTRRNDVIMEQSWQDLDYSKLQNVGLKAAQNDNQLSQLSHESIAILMSQTNNNKGMTVVAQTTDTTVNTEIDRTQI